MPPAFFLSENDHKLVQELLSAYHSGDISFRSPKARRREYDYTSSPDVYIAKPPEGGIPALVSGTPDVAGKAECDIYQINDNDELVQAPSSFSREVYNLSPNIIETDWIIVRRDKYGRWIVANRGDILFGKLDGDLNEGSSAVMSIWDDDPLADTGKNITVHDWFLQSGETLDSGKKVKAELYGGKWYATAGEC